MSLSWSNWLRIPANHQIIGRWTLGGPDASHTLELPPVPDARFRFLALGDSGDSDPESSRVSPQDAVARELALDARLPGSPGQAAAILHTGDVVYMTGERRLYDRSFRRPYAPFMTPESTFERLVFRLPFLPIPGNHDYYDFSGWAAALIRVPLLGHGLRLVARELFAFATLPQGGSGMGRAYMEAFVDQGRRPGDPPRPYLPSEWTRLPNRYYRFRLGSVDVFAVDSNTLDAPPPGPDADALKADAAVRARALEARAAAIDRALREAGGEVDRLRQAMRQRTADDAAHRAAVLEAERRLAAALEGLAAALRAAESEALGCARGADAVDGVRRRLDAAAKRLDASTTTRGARTALDGLAGLEAPLSEGLREVEGCLVRLPEGPARAAILAAGHVVDDARDRARLLRDGEPPPDLAERVRTLSQETLEVQRLLAFEERRRAFRPDDYDAAQMRWLERELETSARENPDGWRVVYLHHPPYTTLTSYCEHPELQGIRENLLPLLRDRVHVVLGGHAHAFEWIRSAAAPRVAFVVTGGGGQASLRRSVVDPSRVERHRQRYERLRQAGVVECAVAGRGPAAPDGEDGFLYHYVRFDVTEETLVVRPVGVRHTRTGWRREAPMPVWHAAALPAGTPPWESRVLDGIEVRRDRPPRALWAGGPRP